MGSRHRLTRNPTLFYTDCFPLALCWCQLLFLVFLFYLVFILFLSQKQWLEAREGDQWVTVCLTCVKPWVRHSAPYASGVEMCTYNPSTVRKKWEDQKSKVIFSYLGREFEASYLRLCPETNRKSNPWSIFRGDFSLSLLFPQWPGKRPILIGTDLHPHMWAHDHSQSRPQPRSWRLDQSHVNTAALPWGRGGAETAEKHSIYHRPGLAFTSYDSKAFCYVSFFSLSVTLHFRTQPASGRGAASEYPCI